MAHPIRSRTAASILVIGAAALLAAPWQARAANAPASYDVSPEVYKVLADNDDFRVIKATWAPGARDSFHSHPVSFVSYFLTDCSRRFHFPDGRTTDLIVKKGQVIVSGPIESHSFENTGTETCEILLVDKKQ